MTKGSGDARTQPLYFLITTAGTDRNSICFEQHQKAVDIIEGRKIDPTFYPVIMVHPMRMTGRAKPHGIKPILPLEKPSILKRFEMLTSVQGKCCRREYLPATSIKPMGKTVYPLDADG